MPITTSRNCFGRQKESFVADIFIVDKKLRDCVNENVETEMKDLKIGDVSNEDTSSFKDNSKFPGIFIRAPGIVSVEKPNSVEILATLQIGVSEFVPVALRRDNLMVTSFHPELTQDLRFHKYFIDIVLEKCSRV